MNKNVLYVIPEMNSGGVEITMLEIAKKNFEEKKINIFLLTSGGNMLFKLRTHKVDCTILNVKSKNPITIYKNIKKIEKIIKEKNIDIVQVESRAPAWSCYFACKRTGTPLITTVNGLYDTSNIFKRFYNSIICKGNIIIAVSKYTKDYIIKNYKRLIYKKKVTKEIEVIYRSIDCSIYLNDNISINRVLEMQNKLRLPEDKIIITIPARFSKQKGQDYFLKVLKYVENNNYFCIMVGDIKKKPKYVKEVEKLVYKYNLQDKVKICDNIMDMPALYKISNIIVSSSIKPESFGRTAIEAQSMEKIFVGTNIGGTLETVEDGKTGFLAPYNDPKEFAKIIDKVLTLDKKKINKISKNAKENVAKNFTIDNMYNEFVNLYKRVGKSNDSRYRK